MEKQSKGKTKQKELRGHTCQMQFSKSIAHRNSVKCLYRYILRDCNKTISSISFQDAVKDTVRDELKSYARCKNTVTVCSKLQDLEQVHRYVIDGELLKLKRFLVDNTNREEEDDGGDRVLSDKMDSINSIREQIDRLHEPRQMDPEDSRKISMLSKYLSDYYNSSGAKVKHCCEGVPKEVQKQLLLPLAVRAHYTRCMENIKRQLQKGPPTVQISWTGVGKSKICFIRSAINKGKRQSKDLTNIIIQERIRYQKEIDSIQYMTNHSLRWAQYESQWERMLTETINGERLRRWDHLEWTNIYREIIGQIESRQKERAEKFKLKRDELIKEVPKYQERVDKMYQKRCARFQELQDTLQKRYHSPYYIENLEYQLRRFKFI